MNVAEHRSPIALRVVLAVTGLGLIVWALRDDYLIGGGLGFGFFQAGVFVVGLIACGGLFVAPRIGAAVLTSIISLFVGLALIEVALGLFLSPRLNSIYELDPGYLYKFKPGARREYQHLPANGGTRHIYRINQDGFRGEEIRVPPGNPRIAVYGDSFIHAEFSALENTYTEILEGELDSAGYTGAEVINAGVAGYGPDQILRRLKNELPLLQPELLIVSIFAGNDFGDLVRNKLFRLNDNRELVKNNFSFDPTIKYQAELAEHELLIRKALRNVRDLIFGELKEESTREDRIAGALRQQVNEYEDYVVSGSDVVHELRSDPYSADIAQTPESESANYKIELMEAILAAIQVESVAQRVPVMFVLIPHPIDVMRGSHASGKINIAEYPDYSPDRLTDELSNICFRQQLQCLNLMDLFREEGGESLFLQGGDDHWNDRGQGVAAAATVRYIFSEGLLPATGNTIGVPAETALSVGPMLYADHLEIPLK